MQEKSAPSVCAAIDIGSNTVRVVVARCRPDSLDILAQDEVLVRIGESVNATGTISREKLDETITILHKFQALAETHAAHHIFAIATEAIRKATNKEEFLVAIQQATGIQVHLINGDVEATLTFYGVTAELTADTPIGVFDLGGGSMELVFAQQAQIIWHSSIPIGSGWLHDRYFTSDPPSNDDLVAARTFLQTYLAGIDLNFQPPVLFATGGTANTLLLLAQRAFRLDQAIQVLTRDDLMRCEGLLCALTADEIAQRYHIDARRARILVAGTLIIRSVLEQLQLEEIHISAHGIREGVLIAYARYGDDWLYRVEESMTSQKPGHFANRPILDGDQVPFVLSGRRMLYERAEKMLEWRRSVLKNDDIESVHKMRVASRRLRAVMDAYQAICEPKSFKRAYRTVEKVADILGAARDTDVMIEHLHALLNETAEDEHPGIEWLIQRLREYRENHQQELESYLQTFDQDKFMHELDICLPEKRE